MSLTQLFIFLIVIILLYIDNDSWLLAGLILVGAYLLWGCPDVIHCSENFRNTMSPYPSEDSCSDIKFNIDEKSVEEFDDPNEEEETGTNYKPSYYQDRYKTTMNSDSKWHYGNKKYSDCYDTTAPDHNMCNLNEIRSIDERVVEQAKRRNNEKRVLDGWASKNSNYYKKHYSNELDKEEAQVWWGEDEY